MRWNKAISVFILIMLSIVMSHSQDRAAGLLEIGLWTDYKNSNEEMDFIVTELSLTRWEWDQGNITCYYLTSDFDDATLLNVPEIINNFYPQGWNFFGSTAPRPGSTEIIWANVCYGLYKFKWSKQYLYVTNSDSFYLDLRDDRYPLEDFYPNRDFWIKFNENDSNKFSYKPYEGSSNFTTIETGSTVGLWEIFGLSGPPSYERFQPTTPTNLTVSWSNNRPLLTWNCSEPQQSATYEVWRKVMGGPKYLQTIEDWCCISYNQAGDTTYSDNGFSSGSGYKAYYKVRAVSGDGNLYSPGWTNTISVIGSFTPNAKGKIIDVRTFEPVEKSISVSPNPFNNTVHISLESGDSPLSNISIYDLTGRVVYSKQLNGHIGYYDIVWSARDPNGLKIRSGMYFLIVRSGRKILFREKLLYLK